MRLICQTPPNTCVSSVARYAADLQAAGSDEVLPPASRVSRPQKLASPTFQVPSWYTAVPFWLRRGPLRRGI